MKKTPQYHQLIPEKVLQKLPIIERKIKSQIKGFCADNLKEVISIVACHTRKDMAPSPIQICYFKKMVGQGDKYLKGLIDLNVIQRSGLAIKGECSFKYCFSSVYKSKFIFMPLINPKLILRIEKAHQDLKKGKRKFLKNHCEQIKFLKRLSIDPECINFINSNYSKDSDRYNNATASVTRIMNKDFFYCVDITSGRFHSNITNMPKEIRPFLRINGKPLVNIDIKNSQPYLSILLLTSPEKVSFLAKNPAFAKLLQSLVVSDNVDIMTYITLVNSGQLYEYLMDEFAKEGLVLNRDETKKQVLRILFARNKMPKNNTNKKARIIFTNRFPSLHRVFSEIRGYGSGDKFTNFKRFAILLQSIESHLMLKVIMKRIVTLLPNIVALTIHDSILTSDSSPEIQTIHTIMVEELTKFIGFSPNIKIEC